MILSSLNLQRSRVASNLNAVARRTRKSDSDIYCRLLQVQFSGKNQKIITSKTFSSAHQNY